MNDPRFQPASGKRGLTALTVACRLSDDIPEGQEIPGQVGPLATLLRLNALLFWVAFQLGTPSRLVGSLQGCKQSLLEQAKQFYLCTWPSKAS